MNAYANMHQKLCFESKKAIKFPENGEFAVILTNL